MTNEEFNALVFRLEDLARRNPEGYQLRVLLLALLGNAYLSAILLLITAVLLGLLASIAVLKAVAVKLILVVGLFLWMLLKALWVRIPPPEGTQISASEAPDMFAMINELRSKLGAPAFHHVLVTDDFNAGVVQAPRLGIFGWHRNYLLIGLPLMKSLTVDQFKAVLAHEFGHLARCHGRMSNWIYRQRLRWSRLMDALEANDSRGSFLFKPFIDRYAPYFNAYSFPLARANEYEADATSVRLTSPRAAAEALTSVNVVGSYLGERFWPQIQKQAEDLPQPGFMPYSGMGQRVARDLDETSARTWLDEALARKTTSDDTHPALADRLKAINETPKLAPPEPGRAADQLLGRALGPITEAFDRRWLEHILPAWEERHREVQEGRRRLAEFDERANKGTELSLQDAYDRAVLTESVRNDPDSALEQFRALQQREPDDAVLCYSLGVRLLARDDDTGLALVERATALDDDATLKVCAALRDYFWRTGRENEAHAWQQRLIERAQLEDAADKERNQVLLKDKFERHDLSDEIFAGFHAQLQAVPGLRKAYLVKKRVQHFQHRPCYVLGFSATGAFRFHSKRRSAEVLARIKETVSFPGETIIISIEADNYRFGRKFRWMRGSRIL